METMKTIWRGFSGMFCLCSLILGSIGGIGYLLVDRKYLFAATVAVIVAFAFKPMWSYITKTLML